MQIIFFFLQFKTIKQLSSQKKLVLVVGGLYPGGGVIPNVLFVPIPIPVVPIPIPVVPIPIPVPVPVVPIPIGLFETTIPTLLRRLDFCCNLAI